MTVDLPISDKLGFPADQNQLAGILHHLPISLMLLGRGWDILYINGTEQIMQVTKALGLSDCRNLVGKNYWSIAPMFVGTSTEKNLRAAMEKGEIRRWETKSPYTGR